MNVSEHANYLLNEYGRLQFDYAAFCKPDGESLRNEARNNLEEYIAALEEENDRLQAAWFVEETICPDGSLKPKVSTLLSRIAELEYQLEDWAEDYKARIAELEAEVTKCHEFQDSYCDHIAELEAAQRWIPVSERLPEPYTRVLACIKSGYMEVDYMYSEPIVDVGIADFNSLDNVTHWMPLPQSPEVQE